MLKGSKYHQSEWITVPIYVTVALASRCSDGFTISVGEQ